MFELRQQVQWLEDQKRKEDRACQRELDFDRAARRVEEAFARAAENHEALKTMTTFAGAVLATTMPKDGELMPLDEAKEILARERERKD